MPKGFVPLLKTALNIQGPAARISYHRIMLKRMLEQAPAP